MGLLELHQLEEIMQTYTLIKENKASMCQVNDCYYTIFKDNVALEQRVPRIKKWVEDNYCEYYKMVATLEHKKHHKR